MAAEVAQLVSTGNITWAGGRLFDGYVILTLVHPGTRTQATLKDTQPGVRVPEKIKIPVQSGVYDADARFWRTDSLVPPGEAYSATFYDTNDVSVLAVAGTFTVTAATYNLTPVAPIPVP